MAKIIPSFAGFAVSALALALASAVLAALPQELATLKITTKPDGASIVLDGDPCGTSPRTISGLRPGDHLIRVSRQGYADKFATVSIAGNVTGLAEEIVLDPLVAPVLVRSDPEGANVTIDGISKGATPLLVPKVTLGRHTVVFSKSGYIDRTMNFDVNTSQPALFEAKLISSFATVSCTSDPDGAEIFVNGTPRGNAPLTIDRIDPGETLIEARLPGHDPYRQKITLEYGDNQKIAARLRARPGSLRVVTNPGKVRIYVNNELKGESPLVLRDLEPGNYRVRTDSPVHDPMARTVEIGPADSKTEEFTLVPNCGALKIITTPADVTVLVDGKVRGTTPIKQDGSDVISDPLDIPFVAVGTREVKFTRGGYFDQTQTVKIQRDKTVTLNNIALKRKFIPDYEVRTSEGVYKGMLINITGDFIRLETENGVTRAFPREKVQSSRPLREDEKGQATGVEIKSAPPAVEAK